MKCFLKLKNGDFICLGADFFYITRRLSFVAKLLSFYYETVSFPCDNLREIEFVHEYLSDRIKTIEDFFAEKCPFFSLYSFSYVPFIFCDSQYHEGLFLLNFFPDLDSIYFQFNSLFKHPLGFTVFDSFSQAEKFIILLKGRYNKKSEFLSASLSNAGYLSLNDFFNDIEIVKGYNACTSCGKLFQLKTSKDSLCASCSSGLNNKIGYCVICGTEFKYRKGKKTCSTKCRMKLLRKGGDCNTKK